MGQGESESEDNESVSVDGSVQVAGLQWLYRKGRVDCNNDSYW